MTEVPVDSPLRQVPRRIEVDADTLPGAALLGTPEVPTLLGYTRRVLHLHDGCTLVVFSYSNAAKANWLFLIDSRDLSVERYDIPHNDIASHGGALGADGHIYIMPYGNGRAYRFDVETKEFERHQSAGDGVQLGGVWRFQWPHLFWHLSKCLPG